MLKKIGQWILRTLIILVAASIVAGVAYMFVPASTATPLGGRGGVEQQFGNRQRDANRQFANRPPEANNFVGGGDFDRGERGGSLTRGLGELLMNTILLSAVVAVVVGLSSAFRWVTKKERKVQAL